MDIPENSINEILENNPSQGTLYALLTIMKENGRHSLVIKECLKALSRFPEDLALRKILAEAYLGDGRFSEAETEFCKVMKGMKALAGVYRSQAEIYVRQKREDYAADSLRQYLAFFPEDEEAAILLEELQATEDVPPAELPEEQGRVDLPETREQGDTDIIEPREEEEFSEIITVELAETYFNQGKLTEAREIYENLAERDPEDTNLKSRLDEISGLMELKDEAEDLHTENRTRQKKEKMISILDSWRNKVRDFAEKGSAA